MANPNDGLYSDNTSHFKPGNPFADREPLFQDRPTLPTPDVKEEGEQQRQSYQQSWQEPQQQQQYLYQQQQSLPPTSVGLQPKGSDYEQGSVSSTPLAMGIAAIVLAVLGVGLNWIPSTGYLGLLFILPAFVLSIMVLVKAKKKALGVIALVISILGLLGSAALFAFEQRGEELIGVQETVVEEKVEVEGQSAKSKKSEEERLPKKPLLSDDRTETSEVFSKVSAGEEYAFIHQMRLKHLDDLETSKWEAIPESQERFYSRMALLYILTDMDSALLIQPNRQDAQEMVREAQELEQRFYAEEPLGKDVEVHTSDNALFIYDGDTGEATYTPDAG